jgi:rfaE bifunctional protein nucleotidyltransferase chain/domain
MKIVNEQDLNNIISQHKAEGKAVVFTNGCFDLLHVGHVRYLTAAKALGDFLIIGLNSDDSVRSFKGPTRPVNNQDDRAEVLAALSAVDYVVLFSDRTAERLVGELQPDVYVKGGDYRLEDLPEANIVAAYGGRTVLVPEVPGQSTSNLIRKITRGDV